LSLQEVLIISTLNKQKKGEFLVTKDGKILYAPGRDYLTMEAGAILAEYRRGKRARQQDSADNCQKLDVGSSLLRHLGQIASYLDGTRG